MFALNPNVLYLQATPMTEPLLMALLVTSIALLIAIANRLSRSNRSRWLRQQRTSSPIHRSVRAHRQAAGVCARVPHAIRSLAGHRRRAGRRRAGYAGARGVPARRGVRAIGAIAVYPASRHRRLHRLQSVVIGEWSRQRVLRPREPGARTSV